MIEYIVIGALAWTFIAGIVPIAIAMFKVDDPYIPSGEYAEDFAARLGGGQSAGSGDPFPPESADDSIVDFRKLGAGPSRIHRPHHASQLPARRSAAETDRPQTLHLVP